MLSHHGIDYYRRILDRLDDEQIILYDREESGIQCFGIDEYEQDGGLFGFSALDREEQAAILQAIGNNLPTMTKRPNQNAGTSYGIKHAIERFTGFYCSNLQAKTALRILGYVRDDSSLNPCYNITRREWQAFSDLSREVADKRDRECCQPFDIHSSKPSAWAVKACA